MNTIGLHFGPLCLQVTTSAAPPAPKRTQVQYRPAQAARRPPSSQKLVRNTQEGVQPPDYMAYAIIVTLFCCLPFGIIAIMRSSSVSIYSYFIRNQMCLSTEILSSCPIKWLIAGANAPILKIKSSNSNQRISKKPNWVSATLFPKESLASECLLIGIRRPSWGPLLKFPLKLYAFGSPNF